MLEAVCCREAACCSVRADSSSLPLAMSRAAGVTTSIPPLTSAMMLLRLLRMVLSESISWPTSSRLGGGTFVAKFPPAICSVKRAALFKGRVIERSVNTPIKMSNNKPTTSTMVCAPSMVACPCWASTAMDSAACCFWAIS